MIASADPLSITIGTVYFFGMVAFYAYLSYKYEE